MVQLNWSVPALDDLREIRDYISRDSKAYAHAMIKRIREKAGILGAFPEIGHHLPDLPNSPYRQLICGSYRIIHRHDAVNGQVFILAVIHAARLLPSILEQRES